MPRPPRQSETAENARRQCWPCLLTQTHWHERYRVSAGATTRSLDEPGAHGRLEAWRQNRRVFDIDIARRVVVESKRSRLLTAEQSTRGGLDVRSDVRSRQKH